MYDGVIQDLIDELGQLPGVGPKSAQRIAFHLLDADPADVRRLAQVLVEVKDKVHFCAVCGNVTVDVECRICSDPRRDATVLCVVEESKDVVAIERTREFRGRYHVLGGAISPIAGVGPDQLRIRELLGRLQDGTVTEVIIATDPNLEGEATATYLIRMLSTLGLRVSKLASGLPVGGDLEYADELTLGRAFEGRTANSRSVGTRRDSTPLATFATMNAPHHQPTRDPDDGWCDRTRRTSRTTWKGNQRLTTGTSHPPQTQPRLRACGDVGESSSTFLRARHSHRQVTTKAPSSTR